jgi:hypothetical protein
MSNRFDNFLSVGVNNREAKADTIITEIPVEFLSQETGRSPIRISLIVPPPIAVIKEIMITPNGSSFLSIAAKAPETAKAKVPSISIVSKKSIVEGTDHSKRLSIARMKKKSPLFPFGLRVNSARISRSGMILTIIHMIILLFIGEIPHPAEFTLSPKGERAGIRDDNERRMMGITAFV